MFSKGLAFFALSPLSRSLVNSASLKKKKKKDKTDCFPSSFQWSHDLSHAKVAEMDLKNLGKQSYHHVSCCNLLILKMDE